MGADSILYKIIILYIVIITATYGTIFLCKIFNSITYQVIINVSNGTLMIMGLHWMFIGTTNFILEHTLSMTDITYSWVIAIIFALCIDAVIYPFILLSKKHMPILLGK
jgi:fucose 4-O-acetylase-like acetyltransferase